MSIAILGETLSYLRFNCIWPTKDQELNPDKYYHVKLVLMLLSSPIILIGSTLHLIVSLKCKYHFVPAKYQKRFRSKLQQHQRRLDHDDRRGRGLLLHRDIRRVPEANRADLRRLIGFCQLRKTTKFRQGEQKVVALVEDVQIVHRLCHYKRLFVTFHQQEVLREAEPRKRVQRDLRFVGHNLDALQYRRFPHQANFLSFATLYTVVFTMKGAAVISFAIMETIEHLVLRIKHLKLMLNEAVSTEDATTRQQRFAKCIEYHINIFEYSSRSAIHCDYLLCFSIGKRIDEHYTMCLFLHVLLTGALFGCIGYRSMEVNLNGRSKRFHFFLF
jgi:hypothetical protein